MESVKIKSFREVKVIAWLSVTVFLFVAFLSYSDRDSGWSQAVGFQAIDNLEGVIGAYCADFCLSNFGLAAYLIPCLAVAKLLHIFGYLEFKHPRLAMSGYVLLFISVAGLLSLYGVMAELYSSGAGGWFGRFISFGLLNILNPIGSSLFLITILFVGISLLLNDGIGSFILTCMRSIKLRYNLLIERFNKKEIVEKKRVKTKSTKNEISNEVEVIEKPAAVVTDIVGLEVEYIAPSTNLLNKCKNQKKDIGLENKLNLLAASVEEKLKAYNVKAEVVASHPGPVITQLELKLASGIKASKISSLANDLARLLSVRSVRVVEIIPGKTTVGLELPNDKREMVNLKEILDSRVFQQAESILTLALGKDISGNPVVVDLAKMPHLLVAGTTGSGKSVGVNAMILSLLYKASPEDLKLVLIDPKMLELSVYQDIPHLLTPVVTDVQEAAGVLRWCVQEMERRYQLMALLGVRNIKGYNEKLDKLKKENKPATYTPNDGGEPEELTKIPYIVVVADEFADMMMVVGKSVEQQIARIAQKARAAGIHLILATQRPSVDVITGLIKANVPSRIAFQVSSKIDSRTILDQQGADQLLGSGDMLYLPVGASIPTRVHGAFVEDDEVHRVVKALKKSAPVDYNLQVNNNSSDSQGHGDTSFSESSDDPLYKEAIEFVIKSKKASISSIQRKFRIGYNRAATLIEKMEEDGLIGPMQSAGKRDILVKSMDDI